MIERTSHKTDTEVTFSLPPDHPADGHSVSVVGDFNNWNPATNPLLPREDGSRAATVRLPAGRRTRFRYLADPGQWFNEDDADGRDGYDDYLDA